MEREGEGVDLIRHFTLHAFFLFFDSYCIHWSCMPLRDWVVRVGVGDKRGLRL